MVQDNIATSDPAETGELEQSLETTTQAMIEQISAMYRECTHKVCTRDDKRIKFNDQVRICSASAQGVPNGPSMMAEGCDLSLWGISMLSPQPFEVDTCLVVEFTLPGGVNHVVTMLGQVRHARSDDRRQAIGCEFIATLSD